MITEALCKSCGAVIEKHYTEKCGYCGIEHNYMFVTPTELSEISKKNVFMFSQFPFLKSSIGTYDGKTVVLV